MKKYSKKRTVSFCVRGFSAVEVLVSLSLVAVVALFSAYVTINAKKVELTAEGMNAINQEQTLALQKVKTPSRLREALLAADSRLDLQVKTSAISKCFGGRGASCQTLFDTSGAFLDLAMLSETVPASGGRTVTTSGKYSITCTQDQACEKLSIKLNSILNGGVQASFQILSRQTMVHIPGRSVIERQQISFDCATSVSGSSSPEQILTGIDLINLMAICTPLPSTNAVDCNDAPMTQYLIDQPALCQNLENLNCATTGVQTIGVLANQSNCWSSTTNTTMVPPTTTSSTTTTTLLGASMWWCRNAKSADSPGNYNPVVFPPGDGPLNHPNLVCQKTKPTPAPGIAWFCRPVGSTGLYCPTAFGNGQTPSSFPNLECIASAPGGSCI